MAEAHAEYRLSTDEDSQKADTLFSKKFREYLTEKKSLANREKNYKGKDYSTSSGETTASESSRKSGKKVRKKPKQKQSPWTFNFTIRNRLTQCSLIKSDEEVAPPEDLKPLLLNMTILLQDLKQSPSEYENLYSLISKITILVTEFIRRPFKKALETNGEQAKKVEKTVELMLNLLQDYKNGPNLDSDNKIWEYKRLEKEIVSKTHQIGEAEKKLSGEMPRYDPKIKDVNLRVRNSIVMNERLKSEIKFNQNHAKKYKKMLLDREWVKHKLETELSNLRKRMSKVDLCDGEPVDKFESPESSLRGETVQHVTFSSKPKGAKTKKGKEIHKSVVKPK